VNLADRVIGAVSPHPAVRSVRLAGSRADGRATDLSDWDFLVEAEDFDAVVAALPGLVAPLDPLVEQWDRLSNEWCYMLLLRGPVKVDLIFPNEPHEQEPPWQPSRDNLAEIDAHFWDWTLWLRSKEAGAKTEQVESELVKLFDHLLGPLGAVHLPSSVAEAVESYRALRARPTELEQEVAPVITR
jgi:predicted nucleotidyltransferase